MASKRMIKVCGMREGDNICRTEALGVDMIGFIFYPKSPRYVDVAPSYLPVRAQRVGVFVDEAIDTIIAKRELFALDYIQLHGSESADYCRELRQLGLKVIKAFSVSERLDIERCAPYEGLCDLYIFDTKCSGYGGSGVQFDWQMLEEYRGSTPFLLSGGIDIDSIEALRQFNHHELCGYDLNSRFESSPANKNIELLRDFLDKI